jgi:hypothetical protein
MALGASARAETLACRPIPRVPFTIPSAGVYCLTHNLASGAASGAAITIAANDVVLDLNGWTLDGSGAGTATEAVGISGTGRSNLTIKNGTVRGFQVGVQLASLPGAHGHVVEGIRADRNTLIGIVAGGDGLVVRDNLVLDTGGSTAPAPIGGLRPTGISAFLAPGSVIRNNQVVGTTGAAGSFAYDIWAGDANGILIEGNVVHHPVVSPAFSFGIQVPFSQNAQVVNNRISDVQVGVDYSSGATGKYRDNLTDGVATPFAGTGTDAGGNN